MKQDLNIAVTVKDLEEVTTKLANIEMQLLEEFKTLLNLECENMNMVLYTSAIVNRGMALVRGFIILTASGNYITAVPLIRLQLDNCLRFYAGCIVKDFNNFHSKYLDGVRFSKIRDKYGKPMNDKHLAETLDKLFPGVYNLYENASGFIHLSNEHAFLQTEKVNIKERIIGLRVGRYDYFSTARKVDFIYNMLFTSELLHFILSDLVKYIRNGSR